LIPDFKFAFPRCDTKFAGARGMTTGRIISTQAYCSIAKVGKVRGKTNIRNIGLKGEELRYL
jgi:hypothetical protein